MVFFLIRLWNDLSSFPHSSKGQAGPQGPPGDVGDPGHMVYHNFSVQFVCMHESSMHVHDFDVYTQLD